VTLITAPTWTPPDPQPGTYPIPKGRGRWRLTLHRRVFDRTPWTSSLITELPQANSRKLVQTSDAPAQLTFVLDGHDQEAALILELQHDVVAWRWDDARGVDEPMFRGIVSASEDDIDEQQHTVAFTCTDYLGVLGRRFLTQPLSLNNVDQDDIVSQLVSLGGATLTSSSGTALTPGSVLPISVVLCNPDGSARLKSGTLRVRNYLGQQNLGTALNDLANVIGGFDYDLAPGWRFGSDTSWDALRVFFPQQGVTLGVPGGLSFPGNIAQVKRQIASADYANYIRILGNNQSSLAATAQFFSEAWNTDATNTVVGLWMDPENAASTVDQATLDQDAQGDLVTKGTIIPIYTLTLTPGWYWSGAFHMGDTVPLAVTSGRLNVNTAVRILGIEYDVGDDGNENVVLTVGRAATSLLKMLKATNTTIEALVRR
jgi:hypothetical protein